MTAHLERAARTLLGGPIVWFGIRAEDAWDVWWDDVDLRTVAFLGGADHSMETATGQRVNPDAYEIDTDETDAAAVLIERAVQLAAGGVIVAYRPSIRLFERASSAGVTVAAMKPDVQRGLENKPWVDRQVRGLGLTTLGWRTVRAPLEEPDRGPVVVRGPGGGGGTGMYLASSARDVPPGVVVSRYLDDAISVNLTGCCFPDGTVTVHLATVQLIGIAECTDLDFGYCGNDAAALAGAVDGSRISELRGVVSTLGSWLNRRFGWLGAFGVDVLITERSVIFCELNPRFQGSANLVSTAARRDGRPGLHVEHLAAFLGIGPHRSDQVGGPDFAGDAQVVLHNTTGAPMRAQHSSWDDDAGVELVAPPGTQVAPGAPLARWRGLGPVTTDGRSLIRNPLLARNGFPSGRCS